MAGNSFGQLFKLSTFGESHGPAIGGILDGCPAGLQLDLNFIQAELDRRKPGQSKIVSQRKESDQVQFLSGIIVEKNNYITTGTPIGFIIPNEDQKSKDYDHIKDVFRPSHADFTYQEKYGIRDHKGGGRSSARETAARVVAGAIAKLLLKKSGIEMISFVSQAGTISIPSKNLYLQRINNIKDIKQIRKTSEENMIRCPDPAIAKKMIELIEKIKKEGDTIGGIISTTVIGVPTGIGEPVFDKLHADIGKAMLSINAVKGFEYGSGFDGTLMKGSEHNDLFVGSSKKVRTQTNHSGGIQGGISNGENIYFNVAFKPVATLIQKQKTLNSAGKKVEMQGKGRHDPCVLPRAVPIVEAMTALVLADHLLRHKTTRL